MRNPQRFFRPSRVISCVLLVSLSLTLLTFLEVTPTNGQTAPSVPVWNEYIANLPAPHPGCFVANYPNEVWQETQCGPAPTEPMTVGKGNDWAAQTPGPFIGKMEGAFIPSGVTSEKVGTQFNSYSIQLNSNAPFPTSWGGKATTGWVQFIYLNRVAPSPSKGEVYIEYWLLRYHATYGNCPSGVPTKGATNWITSSADCYFNTAMKATPFMKVTKLLYQKFYAYANFKGSGLDEAMFCFTAVTNTCYKHSEKDTLLSLSKHWTWSEFNILGNCCASEAIFNKGASIVVSDILYDQAGNPMITPSCLTPSGWVTAETNNLNLGTCSGVAGSNNILFTESD